MFEFQPIYNSFVQHAEEVPPTRGDNTPNLNPIAFHMSEEILDTSWH